MSYTLPGGVRKGVSFSESRSEVGITRSVVGEREEEGVVLRDTSIAAEISQSRNTSLSSNINFDIGRFKLRSNTSFGQNRRTNTASAQQDARQSVFWHGQRESELELAVGGFG